MATYDPRLDPKVPGSPANALGRMRKTERLAQLIRDIESCNDNNPNFRECPMDAGADRVALAKLRACIAQVECDRYFVDQALWKDFLEQLTANARRRR